MADNSKIEWTDATWNVVTGCDVLSPGCTNCYAMRLAGTRLKHHATRAGLTRQTKTGPVWNGEVRFNEGLLDQPLRWRRPRRIFVCAHGDLFYEKVPDEWIDRVFAVMALCPQHTFQVLTKRSARMREYMADPKAVRRIYELVCDLAVDGVAGDAVLIAPGIDPAFAPAGTHIHLHTWPLPNVWPGVSVEDQTRADERRAAIAGLAAQGWLTWVSYEPALGPVDWSGWQFIRWLVAGGESAQNKPGQPAHPDWFRDARDWCRAAGVAFNFKQWGDWVSVSEVEGDGEHYSFPDHATVRRVGARRAGRALDGRTWDEFPDSPSPSTGEGRVRAAP